MCVVYVYICVRVHSFCDNNNTLCVLIILWTRALLHVNEQKKKSPISCVWCIKMYLNKKKECDLTLAYAVMTENG